VPSVALTENACSRGSRLRTPAQTPQPLAGPGRPPSPCPRRCQVPLRDGLAVRRPWVPANSRVHNTQTTQGSGVDPWVRGNSGLCSARLPNRTCDFHRIRLSVDPVAGDGSQRCSLVWISSTRRSAQNRADSSSSIFTNALPAFQHPSCGSTGLAG
jgi:hypothetical protein